MSTPKQNKPATIVVKKMPVVIGNYKIFNNKLLNEVELHKFLYKDDIMYEGSGDFLKENQNSSKIVLLNRSHRMLKTSLTVLKCYTENGVVEKTSENITNLIGQDNYDTVFCALSSVLSQELRLKGIIALLTIVKDNINNYCQTESEKKYTDASTQTVQSATQSVGRKVSSTKRKIATPYIVKDTDVTVKKKKKIVINPYKVENDVQNSPKSDMRDFIIPDINYVENTTELKMEIIEASNTEIEQKLDRNIEKPYVHDETSRDSIGNISLSSFTTNNSIFDDLSLLNNVDRHMQQLGGFSLNIGGQIIKLHSKPEDEFHIATSDNLKFLSPVDRQKLLLYQATIDFENCLNRDEDGNMPLHLAVKSNDIELLKRQCAMLKIKKQSVDIPVSGNYTALKMSIVENFPSCTGVLLHMGADPLQIDEDHRTPLHYAAEGNVGCTKVMLQFCKENARKILKDNEDLWKCNYDNISDDQLAKYLLDSMCSICDNQGYTPLMLAARLGNYENAQLLVMSGPNAVNLRMPTSGNTALYLTVTAAYEDALDRANKANLSHKYRLTLDLLLENGAQTTIENYAGGNVELLLSELNVPELSMVISNKLISLRFFQGKCLETKLDSIMLVKNETGDFKVTELNLDKSKKLIQKKCRSYVNKTRTANKLINAQSKNTSSITIENPSSTNLNVTKQKSNKIQIIENVPIKIETDTNNTVGNSSVSIVLDPSKLQNDTLDTNNVCTMNKKDMVSVSNMSPIIKNTNINCQIPNSKLTVIQKTPIKMQKIQNTNCNNESPLIIESVVIKTQEKPITDQKRAITPEKPEFVDTYKNFIKLYSNTNIKCKREVVMKRDKLKKVEKD